MDYSKLNPPISLPKYKDCINPPWSSSQICGSHRQSPLVANGVLYISDEAAHLTAYSLSGTNPGLLHYFFVPVNR